MPASLSEDQKGSQHELSSQGAAAGRLKPGRGGAGSAWGRILQEAVAGTSAIQTPLCHHRLLCHLVTGCYLQLGKRRVEKAVPVAWPQGPGRGGRRQRASNPESLSQAAPRRGCCSAPLPTFLLHAPPPGSGGTHRLADLKGSCLRSPGFPNCKYTNLWRFPKAGGGVFKAHGGVDNLHPQCMATDGRLLESPAWELRVLLSMMIRNVF